MDAEFWDERYRSRERLFSGAPNGVLVDEVKGLTPGQALDVGCGEGGDALWLARQGWRVTATDISRTALERAAAEGADVADRVAWIHGDLTSMPPPAGNFDLVSAHYFPLPLHKDVTGLLDAVAPGGTLLFVGHDLAGLPADMDPDPRGFYQPSQVADLLDASWVVEVNETRPRTAANPEGAHHTHDTVLRARRVQ
ncbi:class I SAM-dependent methyltransferase [Actinoplanes sp. NBRC 103695]|uniref:class I SAM-dependent methyltransferase n=1 Tax=Actinoplanes sp. NBRC 103695 TaxID=3032202 RepID=UPI0024A43DFD|nr:class I SAM-dependent methyltransferase [Actinoplanes sp. NBRC 103695]GLY97886.1 methyltransferase [Actinoplanes sp. NBRC 103695]